MMQGAPKPDFSPLHNLLGELMPDLMLGPRGRQRLTLALTQRFGENWRMNRAAQDAVKHFEGEEQKFRAWYAQHKGAKRG